MKRVLLIALVAFSVVTPAYARHLPGDEVQAPVSPDEIQAPRTRGDEVQAARNQA